MTHSWRAGLLSIVAIAWAGCGDSSSGGSPSGTGLGGRVTTEGGAALSGVMVTAYDDAAARSTSVFTDGEGRFRLPALDAGAYRVRARLVGYEESFREDVPADRGASVDFTLAPARDVNAQLPANYFYSLIEWPSARVRGDFSRACANCHQIGSHEFREPRSADDWHAVIDRMTVYGGVPFFDETRPVLRPTLLETFGPGAIYPRFAAPPAPSGDAVRAVITEWEIDPVERPGCHDLELAADGTVFMVPGMYALDPATNERRAHPLAGGGHSVERAADGSMWITAPGPEELIRLDVETGEFTHYPHPRLGEDLGSYPHTLRFDDAGILWETLTRSNHVARFDPATGEFRYFRLPLADPAVSGVPIPVAYGLDVAPDQSIWWSQLFGHRIGRIDPETGEVRSWQPPFDGPRRLFVGPDGVVWVPGYGASVLGRFDPKTESWTVYPLPTHPRGSELPYAITVDRASGDVWITGSNSDSMIRFRPSTEEWTIIPLPTPVDFTREIEIGDDGSIWTCTSDGEIAPDREGTGRLIRIELLEREGDCGDGAVQLGEECDDRNAASCDGCSAACRLETGPGDGAACGAEACDDGNQNDCDGCSRDGSVESGWRCGDGVAACGEECDPPGEGCSAACQRIPTCGDGVVDAGEECDDGNSTGCDGCSAACRSNAACGDGDLCGGEACDDGNLDACDGCSPACALEVGSSCGDGVPSAECGEECDPPGGDCSLACRVGEGALGTRHFSFGGSFYSSALGAGTPLGELRGVIDLVAGAPDEGLVAPVSVAGPSYFSAAILGGTYGTYCVRLDGCTGLLDCDGGTAADTLTVQDSAGPGTQGNPVVITTGLGEPGPAGAMTLECEQAFVQLLAGAGDDCVLATYPPASRVAYTTGRADAYFTAANPKVGNATLSLEGEPFVCGAWPRENGSGRLVGSFLVEEDPQAGDIANANRLED